ncbi:MAG: hypothetical protein J6Y89_00415 [Lachnospiraceae bacterium]|nr:hypothetical protein [Lachnospiraceae bacterium]
MRKDRVLVVDDDEFAIVKAHTVKGYQILKEITDMPKLSDDLYKYLFYTPQTGGCTRRDTALPKIETKELKEAYQTIAEIAESMDYGMMEDMLKSLNEYELPEKDRRIIDEVGKMLIELDWDGILSLVKTADT